MLQGCVPILLWLEGTGILGHECEHSIVSVADKHGLTLT